MSLPVTLIGFGEAGQTFARQGGWGTAARAYDKLTDAAETRPAKQADYAAAGVAGMDSAAAAVAGASVILSLVTADQALEAARSVAQKIECGTLYVDFNSVAPQTKREAARAIEAAGGLYVDAAIMAPVKPKALGVALLISGPASKAGEKALTALGFSPRIIDGPVGQASTIKMLRSVIVKGIEALTAECFLAAEAEGVAAEVARSLDESEGGKSWSERAHYNLERITAHGLRRAAEMEEAAKTVEAISGSAPMSKATAFVQRRVFETRKDPAQRNVEAA